MCQSALVGVPARCEGRVATRVGEHYGGPDGTAKRETWERIVVVGLFDDLPVDLVRQVEGRVAFARDPGAGYAPPTVVTRAHQARLRPPA